MNEQPNTERSPRDGPVEQAEHVSSPGIRLMRDLGQAAQSLRLPGPDGEEASPIPELLNRERVLGRIAIYAASLLDYNSGILHGQWLDAAVDPEELEDGVQAMLSRSPTAKQTGEAAEEWAIHDYQGFGAVLLDEYAALPFVARLAQRIEEHGLAYAAWVNLVNEYRDDQDWSIDRFEDSYLGEWDSTENYAEHLLDDLGLGDTLDKAVSDGLRPYVKIDAEAFARDLELSGDVTAVERPEGGVWVFGSM